MQEAAAILLPDIWELGTEGGGLIWGAVLTPQSIFMVLNLMVPPPGNTINTMVL